MFFTFQLDSIQRFIGRPAELGTYASYKYFLHYAILNFPYNPFIILFILLAGCYIIIIPLYSTIHSTIHNT